MQPASIQWIVQQKFSHSTSGHAGRLIPTENQNKVRAMEMVLMASGAAPHGHGTDLETKAPRKIESLEVLCSGERAAEPHTVWTKLEVLFRLRRTSRRSRRETRHVTLPEEKYCLFRRRHAEKTPLHLALRNSSSRGGKISARSQLSEKIPRRVVSGKPHNVPSIFQLRC